MADEKGVARVLETSKSCLHVLADEHRRVQSVGNLLPDGIKFTSDGGSVVIWRVRYGQEAIVTVTDTEIGMTQGHFEKFHPWNFSHRKAKMRFLLCSISETVTCSRHGQHIPMPPGTSNESKCPQEVLGQLFERFWQADSSKTREQGGTGTWFHYPSNGPVARR